MKNGIKSELIQKKITWAVVAGMLAGIILIFDFITKGIGVVDEFKNVFFQPEPVIPTVAVRVIDANWGSQCLEFAFENLPKNFTLGRIMLEVKSTKGPSPTGGNQTAEILSLDVQEELSTSIFMTRKPIELSIQLQAEKERDAFYINYCPTLNRPGLKGSLTVTPKFLTPTGIPVKGLQAFFPELNEDSVTFNISRPRNLFPHVVPYEVRSAP